MTMAMYRKFDPNEAKRLFKPSGVSKNGTVTIIGGSELFHGAPFFALMTASRIVDMVFFSSPDPSIGEVANLLKSKLSSFIWVPWGEVKDYIIKSDAALIGPGLMRFRKERDKSEVEKGNLEDDAARFTSEITKKFLTDLELSKTKWVIDAGSLQVMDPSWIPHGAILTPNQKEYKHLFGDLDVSDASQRYNCTIVLKGMVDKVCSGGECVEISGGNAGLAKGGTGDTLAGLIVALAAKNDNLLASSCSSYVVKTAGDELFREVRTNYNADDLVERVPRVLADLQK